MPIRKNYRLPSARHSPNSGFYWLLVVLAAITLGWVWWQAGRPALPKHAPAKKPLVRQATNPPVHVAVVQRVNAPVVEPTTNPAAIPSKPEGPVRIALAGPPGSDFPRPVRTVLEAQIALDRQGISAGSLDGKSGPQTRAAMQAFQRREKIPTTGELDAATKSRLLLTSPSFVNYTVTSNDLARLQPVGKTWTAKAQQTALDYETLLELVAEQSHAHPALIQRLNPTADWTNLVIGTLLQLPNAMRANPPGKAALVKISLAEKTLEAFDADDNLLAHFPCSIAQRVEKRPVGELRVAVVAPDPNYTFDPAIFPESPEAQRLTNKLVVPPGPNNPVGMVWIGLDKPGYGMHGTPSPEMVGRTESHGCFRLANWNAEYLLKLVWIGMPVLVEP